jgi:glycosyltransferase involved in cell wall biosynthesis
MSSLFISNLPPTPPSKTNWPWDYPEKILPPAMPSGRPWPLVTIVTPSFNQGEFIEETIRSILLQGYPNLEYIIIDGGSTDNSVEIIKKYEPWLKYWVSEPDSGQSHAINKGFSMASGEVFGWLNSDDIFLPGALEKLMLLRMESPGSIAWVGACQEIDHGGKILKTILPRLGTKKQLSDWFYSAWFAQPSCLFDGVFFQKVGGVREYLRYVLDVDLWIRLIEHGHFVSTDYIISAPRMYAGIKTFEDFSMRRAEHILICFENDMPDMARSLMKRYEKIALETISYRKLLRFFINRSLIVMLNILKIILRSVAIKTIKNYRITYFKKAL